MPTDSSVWFSSRRCAPPLSIGERRVVGRRDIPRREGRWPSMNASFVRHRGRRDHVYVTRSDGSMTDWAFPSYGDDLPHDLCHLVIEYAHGISNGIWELVDDGNDVQQVDNKATLVRHGRPLRGDPDTDLSGLIR